jgi:hypothetical protein
LFTRIRGLLTKAESSDFAEEADAFMAKAQELMTRYCVDRTMVEADAEGDGAPQVDARRVWLEDPYLEAKALLLANVASANRCRAVVDPDFGFSTLVGHPRTSTQRTCSSRPCSCRRRGASRLSGTIRRSAGVPGSRRTADLSRGLCREDRFSPA